MYLCLWTIILKNEAFQVEIEEQTYGQAFAKWIDSCLLWYQSGYLWSDERQTVPDISLMVSGLKLSILRNELHYSLTLPKYSLFPLSFRIVIAAEPNGHVGWYYNMKRSFYRRSIFNLVVIFTSVYCFYNHIHVFNIFK
jgi:hypothetical protein